MDTAFDISGKGLDNILMDGDSIKLGEKPFDVFHITAQNEDSKCLICIKEGVRFAGYIFSLMYKCIIQCLKKPHVLSILPEKDIKTVNYGPVLSMIILIIKFQLIKD